MSSEFDRTNKEFKIKIHQKRISDNYKKSAQQWKKLFEEEHRKFWRLQTALGNFIENDCASPFTANKLKKILDELEKE